MKILITGAGGAAAVSVWKSLAKHYEVYMADIDPCAAGLYLVPASRRFIIPSGKSPDFFKELLKICVDNAINVLIPTVDVELLEVARQNEQFVSHGIRVPLSSLHALELCRDKYKLLTFCQDTGLCPSFSLLNEQTPINSLHYPCFAKPCLGSGANGAMVIHEPKALDLLPKDNSYLVQDLLPGDEYSVDVYVHSEGTPVAAVPRLRMKIDSGIAVAARTVINSDLSQKALTIIQKVGIRFVANIQFKADAQGDYKLLEINPRFPGTLPLTAAAGIDIPQLLMNDLMGKPFPAALMPFKEIMVVRYWTEQFIAVDEWRALCQD